MKSTAPSCPCCGSNKIIPNTPVANRGEVPNGVIEVIIRQNPKAFLFKQAKAFPLKANICGKCGHVETFIEKPEEAWEHYKEGLNKYGNQ